MSCIKMQKIRLSLVCFRDIADLKMLQSDRLRVFWPISQEPGLSQTWNLCRITANSINFHYRTTLEKINDHIF